MTAFAADARPLDTFYSGVTSPLGGTVGFSPNLKHATIGNGWATWSHGYAGDVYKTAEGITTATLTMPSATTAFYLYAEPNNMSVYSIAVTSASSTTTRSVNGDAGANGFGVYADAGDTISSISIVADPGANGFAVGEFGIASSAVPEPGQLASGLVLLVGAAGYCYRKRLAARN